MKMKKKLTTLVSCVVILGFTAAVEAEGKVNEYESRRDGYRYHSSSHNRYYPESRHYRYHRKYERKILRKIRRNERRILKLERKIHKISRRAHYRGYHRHSDLRRIRRMEWEIKQLKHRNRYLRRLLNRRYRYRR